MNSKTAVLIFANSPEIDARRKGIQHGEELFENLNKNLIRKVKRSRLPYFISTEKTQKGQNFGERFYNAISNVFNSGYDQIITIGNDTPQLQTQHILKAHKALIQNKTTLGSSADGGFYILGIHKKTFNDLDFKNLAWQTSQLFSQIKSALEQLDSKVLCLETFNDIDNVESLRQIQNFIHQISAQIQGLISKLIKQFEFIFFNFLLSDFGIRANIPFNKGSPRLV
ncbi:TIGR04282 family arsenosugar biosynthesis glycosyltransferase [Mesohalobacter salilacus]|uniref:TIGR04282 family arsenosugar biosynthesis glycosyltransferase n=1 Tax=Mesohalobacter salilacus TaxID=2491711 RepID=UPI00267E4DAC